MDKIKESDYINKTGNEKEIDYNNKIKNKKELENKAEPNNQKEDDNTNEKKIIIYLIIISLILIYIALFFIHYIVDRGKITGTVPGTVTPPDNGVLDENVDNVIVDNTNRFKVKQGETEFSELKELDVFNNNYFEDKSIIAPGVQGSYSFTVENESESRFNYDITFTEENPYNINMVFKVKINGEYVLGNEENWVKGADLSRKDLLLNARTNDVYTIEWRWEDTDYDTPIGEAGGPGGAYYKMYIQVNAEQIID